MEQEKSKIILITDILEHRARKQKELAFYTEQMKRLEIRLNVVRHEISLTERIIKMIETETVEEIKK